MNRFDFKNKFKIVLHMTMKPHGHLPYVIPPFLFRHSLWLRLKRPLVKTILDCIKKCFLPFYSLKKTINFFVRKVPQISSLMFSKTRNQFFPSGDFALLNPLPERCPQTPRLIWCIYFVLYSSKYATASPYFLGFWE